MSDTQTAPAAKRRELPPLMQMTERAAQRLKQLYEGANKGRSCVSV